MVDYYENDLLGIKHSEADEAIFLATMSSNRCKAEHLRLTKTALANQSLRLVPGGSDRCNTDA